MPYAMSLESVRTQQQGFTLVEVMVAITVLLVGVLGTVTMIDGANAVTSRTKAREGGTAVARSVLEIARGIPYQDLTTAQLLAVLQTRNGLLDAQPGVAGHQIQSRGFLYTLTPVVCSMDDPKDRLGSHTDIPIDFCPDSDVVSGSPASVDKNPDDYRRVAVRLRWADKAGHEIAVKQTGVVTNPAGGLGPTVNSVTPKLPNSPTITTGTSATYAIVTSSLADAVSMSVNGHPIGDATRVDNTHWTFSWNLGPIDEPHFVDCNYVLQAQASDDKGRLGAPFALTVTLNRRQPFAPPSFEGGRNLNGNRVDVQWGTGSECDIQRYEVFRGTSPSAIDTPVCTRFLGEKTECLDEAAPAGQVYYKVQAVDKSSIGADRPGDPTALTVIEGNGEEPSMPTELEVCSGGNPDCNDIHGAPAPPGSAVLSWQPASDPDEVAFYRVYRGGATYDHRHDVLFEVTGKPLVFVDAPSGGVETYYVSAVDSLFGESELSGPVTWP
jgi:prepilin-type N-terminal cleavage/methylation domain-containing protein